MCLLYVISRGKDNLEKETFFKWFKRAEGKEGKYTSEIITPNKGIYALETWYKASSDLATPCNTLLTDSMGKSRNSYITYPRGFHVYTDFEDALKARNLAWHFSKGMNDRALCEVIGRGSWTLGVEGTCFKQLVNVMVIKEMYIVKEVPRKYLLRMVSTQKSFERKYSSFVNKAFQIRDLYKRETP